MKYQLIGFLERKEQINKMFFKKKEIKAEFTTDKKSKLIKIELFKGNKKIKNKKENIQLCGVKENNQEILLSDIILYGRNINKGYGTILIKKLIEYAKENNFKKIYGNITEVDWDHIERLEHFYKKFKFKVNLDKQKKCGNIELIL